jgi:hypothetical protein
MVTTDSPFIKLAPTHREALHEMQNQTSNEENSTALPKWKEALGVALQVLGVLRCRAQEITAVRCPTSDCARDVVTTTSCSVLFNGTMQLPRRKIKSLQLPARTYILGPDSHPCISRIAVIAHSTKSPSLCYPVNRMLRIST